MFQKKTQTKTVIVKAPKEKTVKKPMSRLQRFKRKTLALTGAVIGFVVMGALVFYTVDVQQTAQARMPGVNVAQGQLPKYKLNVAKFSLGSKTVDLKLPTVGVKTKVIEVKVPQGLEMGSKKVGVKMPAILVNRPSDTVKTAANPEP